VRRFMILVTLVTLFIGLVVFRASAQTQDVPLTPSSGNITMCCIAPADLDLKELCFERIDDNTALGCEPTSANAKTCITAALIFTPGQDAELKCYAKDILDRTGLLSPNSAIVDFTLPGQPTVVAETVVSSIAARSRLSLQEKGLVLSIEDIQ